MRKLRSKIAVLSGVMVVGMTAACSGGGESDTGTVKVGLLVPLSGAYEEQGADVKDAFELYIENNGDKLSGRDIDVTVADEGDSPETSMPAAEKLLKQDEIDIMVGGGSSANYIAVAPEATAQEVPFVGIAGQPDLKSEELDLDWLWQTSYLNSHTGEAMAPYVHDEVDGPVYAIGPDYEGGHILVNSFVEPFTEMGGELANEGDEPEWAPWPDTTDFVPYFNEIANSDAEAIYTYYGGAPAVDFVKQWAQSDASDIPLYGSFLTEGSVLEEQGEDAVGVNTVMNYSPDIDNDANRKFVSEWDAKHPDRQPNTFTLSGWDAALVLEQALASFDEGEEVTSTDINDAFSNVGEVDSPRGTWQFSEESHVPVQKWYLRTVDNDGGQLSNVVIEELATLDG